MNDSKPLITVAICTYNRHEQLKKFLPAVLTGQALARDLYNVLIVDNSEDGRARTAFAKDFAGAEREYKRRTFRSSNLRHQGYRARETRRSRNVKRDTSRISMTMHRPSLNG